ncbi:MULTISPECIES: nicotinate-nucleotide--dimethylbenzimidazole phosphoribosyltransferase [unclassified Motilimonas]|uniref:nicotinate-nucleotide--dimethylbenzimidazole phosphoribosyltransferase n=1 Tax=Motilimonas TaxID=1914248 RepID=UPI001E2902D5|nr:MULTISPECIES: nicotinate-nucleotide--dimethylbenzimidazole phosphoribosyltransferase [unclassified Motilimonas]MCE0556179.1 nicotinate-nucleotide--dimethylbenzimidazole phosphoribosyltransferase [Motilimonas sp. E26]MDO6524925.1 nicotinate-nucleotide--dimethylbenzimidazole phosphoribosyltransferase [Motilimonas sp. 1_MG-2023]
MFTIPALNQQLDTEIQHCLDNKTKPLGSLGKLESLALQICRIQQTLKPNLSQPQMLVFAADHGVVAEGISLFPQGVTQQMVLNFIQGGAAINCFCRQHGIEFRVVNAGVNGELPEDSVLINASIAKGTQNFVTQAAMTMAQCEQALTKGAELVDDRHKRGANVIGFGEMGIGNTTSAAALMAVTLGLSATECAGRGTGLEKTAVEHKAKVIQKALKRIKGNKLSPQQILAEFGGFEIVMMCGAMLKAAELRMLVLVDGFIATSAALMASKMDGNFIDYAVFCHKSKEQGHKKMLKAMGVEALLDLDMRLGEGSGVAVAYPLLVSAISFVNEMASFDSAGVDHA